MYQTVLADIPNMREEKRMKCPNCGAELDENVRFCTKCGAPQESTGPVPGSGRAEGPAAGGRKPLPMRLIIGGCAAAAAVIILVIVLLTQPKKINLEDYVVVEFGGYNTAGTASVYVNTAELSEKLAESIGGNANSLEMVTALPTCLSAVEVSLDRDSGLSNGDSVTAEITYDNELLKQYKIRYTGESVTKTVEGLEELTEIDPFEGLEVSFTGLSPDGQLVYEYTGDDTYVSESSFTCDQSSGLRNGDVVTISIRNYDEAAAESSGYRFTQTSRQYTVEGLDGYVETYSGLTEEFLSFAKQESQDIINAYAAQDYSDECTLGAIEYAGYIFQTPKDMSSADHYNILYVIYRGTVSHSENDFPATNVYFPVRFNDILPSGGDFTYEDEPEIEGSSNLSGGVWGYYTSGYANPLTAYENLVTASADVYEAQVGDGFEKYESYTPIASLADIAEGNRQTLENRARDIISAYIAEEYSDSSHASELTLAGYYLLVAKSQGLDDFAANNRLIVVYSATVTNDENRFAPTTVYYPVQFEGLANLPGDEFIYTAEGEVEGNFSFENSSYFSRGYSDGAKMFSDLVTASRTDYTYEVSDGLKAFGE